MDIYIQSFMLSLLVSLKLYFTVNSLILSFTYLWMEYALCNPFWEDLIGK